MPAKGEASQSLNVPTLADLIQARRADRGWSYRALADRAGHVFTAQRWQQLGTGVRIKEFPEPATIQAMADALEVDVASVVLAAAASIGLPVQRRNSELAAMLPSNADQLTEEQRDAVLAVIRSMTPKGLNHGRRTEEKQEPGTEAGGAIDCGEDGGSGEGRSPSIKVRRKTIRRIGTATRNVNRSKAQDLNPDDQASEADDFELAAMAGETAELRRRRLEGEPWDQPDPDGPEDGA